MSRVLRFDNYLNESKDPDAMAKEVVTELKKRGVEPAEIFHWEDQSDAGVDIDGIYSVQIADYMPKPFILKCWVDDKGAPVADGQIMADKGEFSTAKELVDEYTRKKINENIGTVQTAQSCLPPGPNMMHTMLVIQATLKLAHWETCSFAQHKALDDVYAEISDLGDSLIEAYIGKTGQRSVPPGAMIGLINIDQYKDMQEFVDILVMFFNSCVSACIMSEDTELNNIADEIRAQFDKLKYLFTLS